MKKISVIVNCHNGEKYLADCLESILKQKYKNLEIILYDNFSTDKSKIIANNFKDDLLNYFQVIRSCIFMMQEMRLSIMRQEN